MFGASLTYSQTALGPVVSGMGCQLCGCVYTYTQTFTEHIKTHHVFQTYLGPLLQGPTLHDAPCLPKTMPQAYQGKETEPTIPTYQTTLVPFVEAQLNTPPAYSTLSQPGTCRSFLESSQPILEPQTPSTSQMPAVNPKTETELETPALPNLKELLEKTITSRRPYQGGIDWKKLDDLQASTGGLFDQIKTEPDEPWQRKLPVHSSLLVNGPKTRKALHCTVQCLFRSIQLKPSDSEEAMPHPQHGPADPFKRMHTPISPEGNLKSQSIIYQRLQTICAPMSIVWRNFLQPKK